MNKILLMRAARSAFVMAALACAPKPGHAQEDASFATADSDDIEEIVVTATRTGDPKDLNKNYEAVLRAQIVAEYERFRALKEQEVWRKSLPTSAAGPSRIKWGYDAQAELRMRKQSELGDLPIDNLRPATLVRIEF